MAGDSLQPTASRAWRHSLSNRVRVVIAQYMDGQSISAPPLCKAKTSKNNSEARLRCSGCFVDFSKRSHNALVSRDKRMSTSDTIVWSVCSDILLLSAEHAPNTLPRIVDSCKSPKQSPSYRLHATVEVQGSISAHCLLRYNTDSSGISHSFSRRLLPFTLSLRTAHQ